MTAADLPAADLDRRWRRARHRGDPDRCWRLRAGAGARARTAGAEACRLRAAEWCAFLDLPKLRESVPAHRPVAAVYACPGPARWRCGRAQARTASNSSPRSDGRHASARSSRTSTPGPASRFDLGNVAIVDLVSGTLASVTDIALFGGANALAVEAAPGGWEVLQFGIAELIAPGRYRLSRLLRGQCGTEGAIGTPTPAGARVVMLDEAVVPLPIGEVAIGLEANWRVGPAMRSVSDRSYRAMSVHPGGRRPAPVCRRPCGAALAHGAGAGRSRDRLDPPDPRAGGRQLERAGSAPGRGGGSLRGRNPRRRGGQADGQDQSTIWRFPRRAGWKFATAQPGAGWQSANFNDTAWKYVSDVYSSLQAFGQGPWSTTYLDFQLQQLQGG